MLLLLECQEKKCPGLLNWKAYELKTFLSPRLHRLATVLCNLPWFPHQECRFNCSILSSHWYLCWAITSDVQWCCEVNSFSQQARYKISFLLILRSICWISSTFLRRREYMELYQASWQQAKMYTTNWKEVMCQPVELPYSHLVSTGLASLRDMETFFS